MCRQSRVWGRWPQGSLRTPLSLAVQTGDIAPAYPTPVSLIVEQLNDSTGFITAVLDWRPGICRPSLHDDAAELWVILEYPKIVFHGIGPLGRRVEQLPQQNAFTGISVGLQLHDFLDSLKGFRL